MPEDDMWKRFTSPATGVVHFAQEEARRLGQCVVGSEHILLGLVREGDGVAARVLELLGVSLGRVRHEVARAAGTIEVRPVPRAPMSLSHRAKQVLEYALEEAKDLNLKFGLPHYVDTEHLLLGVVREVEGYGFRILRNLGVDPDRVRREVHQQLGGLPSRPRGTPVEGLAGPPERKPVWYMPLTGSALSTLPFIRSVKRRRVSSHDRTGGNRDFITLQPGEAATLADIQGAGGITHIWCTVWSEDPNYPRLLVLRAYWDREQAPSIEAPLGDFFGCGHCEVRPYQSLPLNIVGHAERLPGRGGFNCYFPMPFGDGAVFTLTNESEHPVKSFYYYVDYEEWAEVGPLAGRFHCQWRRENPCDGPGAATEDSDTPNLDGAGNYLILEARGIGHYIGCNLSVDNLEDGWFGEGDDMMFIDGEPTPSIIGTGTEDYFSAAWGFPSGAYCGPYQGITVAGDPKDCSGRWTAYRFHLEDPVHFRQSIRVTIEHGHANARRDDYASTAYWYQTEPHLEFPPLPDAKERLPR